MKQLITTSACLAIVLITGVAHGIWTDRWAVSQGLEEAVGRMARLPDSVGDWRGSPLELDPEMLEAAEVNGHFARRFVDARDGGEVLVLLVCGRSGPIVRHTPDVCYQGLGYSVAGSPEADRLAYGDETEAGIWRARLQRVSAAVSEGLVVYWTWNAFDAWEAPDDERVRFASSRYLYKLYVMRPWTPGDERSDEACRDFLRQFLPVLDSALYPRVES